MEAEELERMGREAAAPNRKRPRREGVFPDFYSAHEAAAEDAGASASPFFRVPAGQSLDEGYLKQFSCVVYIKRNYKVIRFSSALIPNLFIFLPFCEHFQKAVELDAACRSCSVPFVWACLTGPLLTLFCDPGAAAAKQDARGFCRRDARQVRAANVSNTSSSSQLVTCSSAHGLRSGDLVSVNSTSASFLVEPVSDKEFQAVSASASVSNGSSPSSAAASQRGISAGDVLALARRAGEEKKYVSCLFCLLHSCPLVFSPLVWALATHYCTRWGSSAR